MKKHCIICVDDEKLILYSLKGELTKIFGNKVTLELAESGEEALEIIEECINEETEIPIIISDYLMDKMYGDEFLKKAHHLIPTSKKILLTGQATLEGVKNSINEANLYRYIIKPWDSTDLKLTLTEAFLSYYKERLIEIQRNHIAESKLETEKAIKSNITENLHQNFMSRNQYLSEVINIINSVFQISYRQSNEEYEPVINRIKNMLNYAGIIIKNNDFQKDKDIILISVIYYNLYLFMLNKNIRNKIIENQKLSDDDNKIIIKVKRKILNISSNILLIADIAKFIHRNNNYLNDLDNQTISESNIIPSSVIIILKAVVFFEIMNVKKENPDKISKTLKSIINTNNDNQNKKISFDTLLDIIDSKSDDMPLDNFLSLQSESNESQPIFDSILKIKFQELNAGMQLAQNLTDVNDYVLVPAGRVVYEELHNALIKYNMYQKIKEPIQIFGLE